MSTSRCYPSYKRMIDCTSKLSNWDKISSVVLLLIFIEQLFLKYKEDSLLMNVNRFVRALLASFCLIFILGLFYYSNDIVDSIFIYNS